MNDLIVISLHGICVDQSIKPIREIFRLELERSVSIRLDLSAMPIIDGAFLGLCLNLVKHLNRKDLDPQFVVLIQLYEESSTGIVLIT